METNDEMKVQVDKLDGEINQVIVELKKVDEAYTHKWGGICGGLKSSFDTMKESYNYAKEHYK